MNVGTVTIGIDGAVVGALAQSGFIVADAEPGDRRITATAGYTPIGKSTAAINVQAGKVSYLRISQRIERSRSIYPLLGPLGVAFWFVDPPGRVSYRNATCRHGAEGARRIETIAVTDR